MKPAAAGFVVFLAVFLCAGGVPGDLLSCNVFMDGFFEIDIRFEKTGEDGSKRELSRENRVGKDSMIFETESGDGNSAVFVVKPKETSMVVFSVRNVEKGTQYFFSGVVNDMGELFAFEW